MYTREFNCNMNGLRAYLSLSQGSRTESQKNEVSVNYEL